MTRTKLGFVVLASSLLVAAHAQNFKGTNVTSKGTGTLTLNNHTYNLREATMFLRPGGEAILTLRGDQTWKLTGRWTGATFNQVSIFLDRGDLPRLNVTGYVFLRNGAVATGFQFSGTSEYGRTVSEFRSDSGGGSGGWGGSGGTGGSNVDLSETLDGRGSYQVRSERISVNRCQIQLFRDGRFAINASGGKVKIEFVGTYKRNRNGDYDLTMSGGFTGATGSGTVFASLNRRFQFERVRLNGRQGRDTWQFSFDRR